MGHINISGINLVNENDFKLAIHMYENDISRRHDIYTTQLLKHSFYNPLNILINIQITNK